MQSSASSSASSLSSSLSNSSGINSDTQPSRTNSNSSAQERRPSFSNNFLSNPPYDQNPWNSTAFHNSTNSFLVEEMNRDVTRSFVENDNRQTYSAGVGPGTNILDIRPNGCSGIYNTNSYNNQRCETIRRSSESILSPFENTSLTNVVFSNNQYSDDGFKIRMPHTKYDLNQTLNVMMGSSTAFTVTGINATNTAGVSTSFFLKPNDKLTFRNSYNLARCNACDNAASLRCLECNTNTCEECSLIHSKRLQHKVIPVPPPIGTAIKNRNHHYCNQHNELLQCVCTQCHKVVCKTCKLQDHADHDCLQISDYRRDINVKLKSSVQANSDGIQHVRCAIDRTVQYMSLKKQTVMEVKNDIHNCFNQIIRCLQDRERYLVDTLTNACDRDLQILDSQKAGLQNILSGLADTNNTLRTINVNGEQMDDVEFSLKLTACHRQLEEHITGYQSLQPKHSAYIFVSPDEGVLQSIRELGVLINDNKFAVNGFIGNAIKTVYLQYPLLGEVPFNWNIHSTLEPICSAPVANTNNSVKPPSFGSSLLSFAEEGHRDGQVSRPWGICVDRFGNILVSDRRNNRIQIFNSLGNLKLKFGRQGDGDGEFDLPAGICVDIDDRIIVVDKDNHRVQIFDQNGIFIQKFGTRGTEYGQFQYPWDVAVNSRRQIVVTDSRNHRIQQFNSKGRFIRHILFNDFAPNKNPASPRGVCYTPTGNIIVSDFDNHCLYLINPEENKNVKVVGCEGSGPQLQFNRPSGVLCDNSGNIVLADSKNQRILVFNPQFMYMWQLDIRPSRNNLMPTYIDEKDRTCDVALMPDGRIVILIELSPDSKEGCNPRKKFVHIL